MTLRCIGTHLVCTLAALAFSSSCFAQGFFLNYLKNYKLGIENGFTNDVATVSYDVSPGVFNRKGSCNPDPSHSDKVRCFSNIPADSQSGLGLFLQQAFKRKGFWHYDFDLGLSFRSMHEGMSMPQDDGPLKKVKFDLYGLFFKPHVTVGITPQAFFPDVLVSLGPSAQVYWGTTTIDNDTHNTGLHGVWRRSQLINFFSYTELELVVWRFAKNGALSLFTANERDTAQAYDGYIADQAVDQMTNIDVTFDRSASGIKLLLSWP